MIPAVDIDALHESIKAALAAQFTDCTVDFYGRPGDRIATPGILLELEDLPVQEPNETGTEQLPVDLNFNAYVVLDYKAGKKQAVKTLAAAVMAYVRGKRWGEPVGAASVIGGFPDAILGKEDAYEVMRVEWQHEAMLGLDIWRLDHEDADGEPLPETTTVYVADAVPEGAEPGEPIQIVPCGCHEP